MSTSLVTVLLIVFAAVALFTVVMGIVLTVVVKTDDPSRGAKRRIQVLYSVAALVGLAFAALAAYAFPTIYVNSTEVPGLLAALAPLIAGILFVDIAAIGESFWPRPKGQKRGAYLTRRPALANAGAITQIATVVWATLLVVSLVLFGFIAVKGGDASGRAIANVAADPAVNGQSGPFPGWPYGIPMLVLAAVLIALALAVLHVIARRPAVSGTTPQSDAQLRRISATNLLKGTQASLAASLAGVLLIAGQSSANAGYWWGPACIALSVAVLIAAVVIIVWRSR